MNTLTKLAAATALAAACALPLAAPASAGEKSEDIVVSPAAMEEWQADTTQHLNRGLVFNPTSAKFRPENGIVQVSFTLGADGKADNIELYDSSSNRVAERIAMRAVRKLRNLDEVPVSNPQDAKFLANLIFADNVKIKSKLKAKLAAKERARIARADASGEYISLGS